MQEKTGSKTLSITQGSADNSLTLNRAAFNTLATIIGGASTPIEMIGTPKQTIVFKEANE